ncbi:hypothetical protein REPUB_Repub05bG0162600 [Reevesia pubescens]
MRLGGIFVFGHMIIREKMLPELSLGLRWALAFGSWFAFDYEHDIRMNSQPVNTAMFWLHFSFHPQMANRLGSQLFVSKLSFFTTHQELKTLFSRFGVVKEGTKNFDSILSSFFFFSP